MNVCYFSLKESAHSIHSFRSVLDFQDRTRAFYFTKLLGDKKGDHFSFSSIPSYCIYNDNEWVERKNSSPCVRDLLKGLKNESSKEFTTGQIVPILFKPYFLLPLPQLVSWLKEPENYTINGDFFLCYIERFRQRSIHGVSLRSAASRLRVLPLSKCKAFPWFYRNRSGP